MKTPAYCLVFALFVSLTNAAHAIVTIDIRAVPGPGYDVGDAQTVTVSHPDATLRFQIWASVRGTDGMPTNEGLLSITGSILAYDLHPAVATGKLMLDSDSGNPFGYAYPFNTIGTPVTVTDNLLGPLVWRAPAMQPIVQVDQPYLLGTFLYDMTSISDRGPFAKINFLAPSAGLSNLAFKIDGVTHTGSAALSNLQVGAPVNLIAVPEPSTTVLLAIGAISLILYARRKRSHS
jgi:hypothetical protein